MKSSFLFFLLSLFISINAQSFIVGSKVVKPLNNNINNYYSFEFQIATNNKKYSIGVFWGYASIGFNYDKYKWSNGKTNSLDKEIYGFVSYLYPLDKIDNFLAPIYFTLSWARIANYPKHASGMPDLSAEKGYNYPNSIDDNIWIISCGYRLKIVSVNVLFGVGYQYRGYDLQFDEYDSNHDLIKRYLIPQKEEAVQFDIGLQYVF